MARSTARPIVVTLMAMCLATVLAACASSSGSIPVAEYKAPPEPATAEYLINVGDMLSILVWDQPQMSGKMRVRTDGRISLPFANDAVAAGKTSSKLASDLETTIKAVVLNPKVTVVVEDS